MSTPKQQPTLFNFFKKTPKPISQSPEKSASSKEKEISNVITLQGNDIKALDLVWAKLEGYPWWPALVYQHPVEKIIYRKKQVHVQFFDDPPTRGWVKEGFIKPYGTPTSCGLPTYRDPQWIKAKEEADQIVNLPVEERSSLIVQMEATEDESSDGVSYLEDSETSKENVDTNIMNDKKRLINGDDDEKEEEAAEEPKTKKRRIVLLSDSEPSGDEYKPDKEDSEDDTASSGVDEDKVSDHAPPETESEAGTPVKEVPKRKKSSSRSSRSSKVQKNISFTPRSNGFHSSSPSAATTPKPSPSVSQATKSKLTLFAAKDTPTKAAAPKEEGDWPHTRHTWLQPDNIRDAKRRSKDDPQYDPRSLWMPDDFLNKQTPAMRQWWELKSNNFDTTLFFKMGKFYELFHMDAILSIQELGLLMMKGEQAHTGFPEIAYGRYSSVLIERGFKVARIEQVETPDMMEKRCRNMSRPSKFDKVVKRELCQVTTLGTRVPSVMDADATSSDHFFLLSVTERSVDGPGENRLLGVAFIDTSIGTFHVGQFADDRHLSRLRTLLAHYPPAQILVERGRVGGKTLQFLKAIVPSAGLLESLTPEKEFWNSSKTLSFLAESSYFRNEAKEMEWPSSIKGMLEEGDTLGLTAKEGSDLAVSCLGSLIWYLQMCKLDENLLSRKMFEAYVPLDNDGDSSRKNISATGFKKRMIMDGTTLRNLEVFENSSTGGPEGSLFEIMNHCATPFGTRMLRSWLCTPLCSRDAIEGRLDAIQDLRDAPDVVAKVKPLLKTLPDLEKLLSKIHSLGLKPSAEHPDARAIYYESKQYSQRKVVDFLAAVNGFKTAVKVVHTFKGGCEEFKSDLLRKCVLSVEDGGSFRPLDKVLKFFDNAFDHSVAKKEGKIIPNEGVDNQYDAAVAQIRDTQVELDDYLKQQSKYFGAKVTYWGNDKKRFQLEVPDHASRSAGHKYELVSQRKGFKRYWTEEIKRLLADILAAEDAKESALQDIARRIFSQFDQHHADWSRAVECLGVLDVLLSLAEFSLQVETTRPVVESPDEDKKPFIHIREGRHPCCIKIFSGGDYIPNDVVMGGGEDPHSPLILVTGPNMGGKSTLMRQTALICLMAQLGSFVPASECRLTAVDRIFTRLGAWDRIYQGESTFFVELAETASIMQHASTHSLVIVDELGRGTATYDGTAIAYSVVKALTKIGCRTLFSTHYHSLVDEFGQSPGISLGHMACMVESENEEDPSQETITFLYKFAGGACPKSYGFNAARLADLPDSVIRSAGGKAKELEALNKRKKSFKQLFAAGAGDLSLRSLVLEVKKFF